MSASNPGLVRRFFRGVWRVVDVSRRVVLNLIFLLILARGGAAPCCAAARSRWPTRPSWCSASTARSPSSAPATCARPRSTSCAARPRRRRCSCATSSPSWTRPPRTTKIVSAVLILDELEATGLATLREIGAAVDRFRATGKKVVAWGSSFDQRQYYIAAHADEVYLHPLGAVNVTGFGGVQQLLQGCARQGRRQRQGAACRHLQGLRRGLRRQRAFARGARGRQRAARLALEDLHRRGREAAQARARLGDEVDRRGAGSGCRRSAATAPSWRSPTRRSTA